MFEEEKVGLGGVVRDAKGDVVAATCVWVNGGFEVDVVKAMAARHALSIAIEVGFINVILQTDCLKLVMHLVKKKRELLGFGNVVSDILNLATSCNSIFFSAMWRGRGIRLSKILLMVVGSILK